MQILFYKATSPGFAGLYNRLVRWWTKGPYSHVEILFSNGMCASSSFRDGGVRLKRINIDPDHWDFIDVPDDLEHQARAWFKQNRGKKYDLLGNLHFIVSPVADDKTRYFCSEAVGAALGIAKPWRLDPNTLFDVLTTLTTWGNHDRNHAARTTGSTRTTPQPARSQVPGAGQQTRRKHGGNQSHPRKHQSPGRADGKHAGRHARA